VGIHSEVDNLPAPFREYLDNLDCPVRVLRGNAYNFTPPESWRGMARANGTTIENCNENGLTIVSWGADTVDAGNPYNYLGQQPGALYSDEQQRATGREWLRPVVRTGDDSFLVGDNVYARTGERIVWYMFPLVPQESGGLPEPNQIDLEKLFGEPITRARAIALDREERRRQAREQQLSSRHPGSAIRLGVGNHRHPLVLR